MKKKKGVVLLLLSVVLGITACGDTDTLQTTASAEESLASATPNPEIVIREIEVIKEVPVVSVETINLFEEPVIDTASAYADPFTEMVDIKGRIPVFFSQPRVLEAEGGVKWTSDNPEIAVVDENGIVQAIKEGTTTIRVMDAEDTQVASFDIYCTTKNDGENQAFYTTFKEDWELYKYCEDCSPEEIQARISTIRDVIRFLLARQAWYDPATPIMANGFYTWAEDAEVFLTYDRGVCCDVTNLGAYLLQYDYEELGFIYHFGSGIGHVYNYVYEDGAYYVFDLTDVISNNQGCYDTDYRIYQLEKLEDFVPIILEKKTDPERLLGVVAVNAMNHTEQPANYLSYIHDDSVMFTEPVQVGFEEGVPFEVLYVNPKAEGMVEFISIPHDEIPYQVPSWFRTTDDERRYWELY